MRLLAKELVCICGDRIWLASTEAAFDYYGDESNNSCNRSTVRAYLEGIFSGSYYEDVKTFHGLWHVPPEKAKLLDDKEWARRVRLISEEWAELCKAHAFGDLASFADGLVDLAWVVLGTAVVAGLPFDALWAEVRRANMDKKGSSLDASGKFTKPLGWKPPDIAGILEQFR